LTDKFDERCLIYSLY